MYTNRPRGKPLVFKHVTGTISQGWQSTIQDWSSLHKSTLDKILLYSFSFGSPILEYGKGLPSIACVAAMYVDTNLKFILMEPIPNPTCVSTAEPISSGHPSHGPTIRGCNRDGGCFKEVYYERSFATWSLNQVAVIWRWLPYTVTTVCRFNYNYDCSGVYLAQKFGGETSKVC